MAKHILQIVETAYRATIEEQDDTILWLTQAMAGAGGRFTVLLRGNAVNYGVKAQDASGLVVGGWRQSEPPRLADDVAAIIAKGMDVYVVDEDVAALGLERGELIAGLKGISRAELPRLLPKFDGIWAW